MGLGSGRGEKLVCLAHSQVSELALTLGWEAASAGQTARALPERAMQVWPRRTAKPAMVLTGPGGGARWSGGMGSTEGDGDHSLSWGVLAKEGRVG